MATNEKNENAAVPDNPVHNGWLKMNTRSWKIRIQRYIRGKPNGKLIWKSIQNGPTPHPMVTDPPPTGSTIVPGPRKKLDSEFNDEENKLEMADTQAEIILSQGSEELYNYEEDLLDEYERFVHWNDPFRLPLLGNIVTNAKQNMISQPHLISDLYILISKAYQPHAKKTLKKQRKAPGNVGNTGARGKKVICYNCRGEGHVALNVECKAADLIDQLRHRQQHHVQSI
ncbi:hypothetical protein Tco_0529500 [Tanacetum coccineum]